MTETSKKKAGGCLCGAVRYEVSGEPFTVIHCHCFSCRRHTGSPIVTFAGFKKGQVRFTMGERRIFESSPGVGRAFCGQCGTPLTWEADRGDLGPIVEFHISTFDDPNAFVPESHLHYDERIAWFDVADNLPRYHASEDDNGPFLRGPAIKAPPERKHRARRNGYLAGPPGHNAKARRLAANGSES
jgi:hypothetical protein